MVRFLVVIGIAVCMLNGCTAMEQLQKQTSYTGRGVFSVDAQGRTQGRLDLEGQINSPDRLKEEGLLRRGVNKLF